MAALTGQTIADNGCIDSFDVSDALLGDPSASGRKSLVLQDNGNKGNWSYIKIMDNKVWKIHRYDRKKAFNTVVEKKLANLPADPLELYELNSDPQEKNKLPIDGDGSVAKKMAAELEAFIVQGDTGMGTPRAAAVEQEDSNRDCLLYTSPSPRDQRGSRMPSSA